MGTAEHRGRARRGEQRHASTSSGIQGTQRRAGRSPAHAQSERGELPFPLHRPKTWEESTEGNWKQTKKKTNVNEVTKYISSRLRFFTWPKCTSGQDKPNRRSNMHRWLSHALGGCIQKSDRNVTPFLEFLGERRRVKKHTALMLKLKGG